MMQISYLHCEGILLELTLRGPLSFCLFLVVMSAGGHRPTDLPNMCLPSRPALPCRPTMPRVTNPALELLLPLLAQYILFLVINKDFVPIYDICEDRSCEWECFVRVFATHKRCFGTCCHDSGGSTHRQSFALIVLSSCWETDGVCQSRLCMLICVIYAYLYP